MKKRKIGLFACILALMMILASVSVSAADETGVVVKGEPRVVIAIRQPKIGQPLKDSSIGTLTLTKDLNGDDLESPITISDQWYDYDPEYDSTNPVTDGVFQED